MSTKRTFNDILADLQEVGQKIETTHNLDEKQELLKRHKELLLELTGRTREVKA